MAHGNEINNKRYYWLKLERNFFKDARLKKLRRLAGGDTYTIIYLELLLLSLELEGRLVYEGIENTFEEEMASKINEWDNLENVKVCIQWLISEGILIEGDGGDYQFPRINIGSESQSNIYKKKKLENNNTNSNQIPTKFQPLSNQIPIDIRDRDKNIIYNNIYCPSDYQKFKEIFDFWNESKIVIHKNLTLSILKTIEKAIHMYGIEQIKNAISHYATVYKDESYFFSYKWSLENFLKQSNALPDFLDNGSKWENYLQFLNGTPVNENDNDEDYRTGGPEML